MKKILAVVLVMNVATSAMASTVDQRSVIVQNNEQSEAFSLQTLTTRTEYRTEVVPGTCYRQEIVGYRRVCNGLLSLVPRDVVGPHPAPGPHPRDPRDPPPERKPDPREPRPNPRPNPRPEPRPEPRPDPRPRPPVCYDEPVYREIAYSCMKTISVAYEVVDHQSSANVNVSLSAAPLSRPQSGNCGIQFILDGDRFEARNSCLEYLAMAKISRQDLGYQKNYQYAIQLFDAEKVFAPLNGGLQDLRVDGDQLQVKTGDLNVLANYSIKLFVERKRFLKSDIVLINRELKAHEFSYQASDSRTGILHVDLRRVLGGFENDKKHNIKIELNLNLPEGSVINGRGMPTLHQQAETTIF